MNRKLVHSGVNGLINVSFMEDENKILCMRCDACNKFITPKWKYFYCPHCQISFLEGVSYDDMKGAETYMDYYNDANC